MGLMRERPTRRPGATAEFAELCDVMAKLNVPDGFRAEIIKGHIVASPWAKGV